MVIKHSEYEVTDKFVGLIWFGQSVIGLDIDDDAVGLVAGKNYIGYIFN